MTMEYTPTEWKGYRRLEFIFEGRKAYLVLPHEPCAGGHWMLKTEYFGAFPNFELEMLARGWHLAWIANLTRWHNEEDDAVKDRFCGFLQETFGLSGRCLPVGMSCGGLMAVIGILAGSAVGGFLTIGGIVLAVTSLFGNRKNSRLERTYLNIIGNQPFISIKELSRITGRNKNRVMKDLQKMLDNNILPENAYIDHAAKCLVLDPHAPRYSTHARGPQVLHGVNRPLVHPARTQRHYRSIDIRKH